jgi:hypothetical protein
MAKRPPGKKPAQATAKKASTKPALVKAPAAADAERSATTAPATTGSVDQKSLTDTVLTTVKALAKQVLSLLDSALGRDRTKRKP